VRRGHRDRAEVDHQPDAEPPDQLLHGRGEPLPLGVRLRAGEQQVVGGSGVGERHHVQLRRGVGRPVVGVEPQRRAPGAVVQQLVHIEPRHRATLLLAAHRLDPQPGGVARIDEPVQCDHQHRFLQLRRVRHHLVQLRRLQHRTPP
jgi:hypothetical protein